MLDVAKPHLSHELITLWQDVLGDLVDVFDIHFVCATFSSHIAKFSRSRVMVGVADDEARFFDLWISEPDGKTRQERWSKEDSGFDSILTYTRPTTLDKLERPASEVISGRLWLETRRRLTVVPILPGERHFAPYPPTLLALIDPPGKGVADLETLENIVDLMQVFMDRAALRQIADRQSVEFAIISDISQVLSSTLNIQEIYQLLRGPIRQMLNVETLSIGLVEPINGDIVFVENLMGPMFERLPPIRLKRGQGIAGWVAENQEPVTINNAYSDQRFFSDVDRSSGFRTQSMICIPLKVDDRTIGVLQAINRLYGRFTEHDLRLIQGLGGPLAAAIENANLHSEVLAEKHRVESLLTSIDEGLVIITRDGLISRASRSFGVLVNANEQVLAGQPLSEWLRTANGDTNEIIARLFGSSGDVQIAADMVRPDGLVIPISIIGTPIESGDESQTHAIMIIADETIQHEVERMRDDLFQGIIQELHTPLATILMYSRLLRMGKAHQPDKAERFLGVIERESDRLQRMIRQMLDLTKIETRELRRGPLPVALHPIFEEILPSIADQAVQKGLLYRQRIENDLPDVFGDHETYKRVLINLLENAVRFTPSGSVQVNVRREDDHIIIEIADEGIGIPPESMNNLFKRFYRTRTAVERGIAGTGLGLYMVKESLRNYNGQISVQSTLGKGSVFTVRLPISKN